MVFVIIAISLKHILPEYDIPQILFEKQRDFINLSEYMKAGSMIYVYPLDGSVTSFIYATPIALFNTLLRPLPFEVFSPLQIMVSLEVITIFIMIISCIYKPVISGGIKLNLVLSSLLFVFTVFLLIGYVTPVSGAIVRYKVPALPFLFFAILAIVNNHVFIIFEKIILKIPWLSKLYCL
jgi:hypothetical protein